MCVDRFHIVFLFLSNPCTPSTLGKEAFVYSQKFHNLPSRGNIILRCLSCALAPPISLAVSKVRMQCMYFSHSLSIALSRHPFHPSSRLYLCLSPAFSVFLPPFQLQSPDPLFLSPTTLVRIYIDAYVNTHKVSYNESGSCFRNFGSTFKVEVGPVKLEWGGFSVKVTKRPRFTSLYLHRPDVGLIPPHAGGIQNNAKCIHFIKFSPWLFESGRLRLFF